MTTYYKATRPDGADFYSGTVDYAAALASGKPLRRKPKLASFQCCSDGVYHASDTPSETLIGGEWPCRLFEVSGRPVASEGRKFGFRSLRVIREIPAWQALGPNGEAVVALIERAKALTPDEMDRLRAARAAARYAAWDAASYAAWDAAWDAASYAAWDAARYAAWDAARDAARDAAWDAARAAPALVVRDLISEEHFNALYGPWASVVNS